MTLAHCKRTLARFLNDPENRVVALSGKWGTGKSHMWHELKKESNDASVQKALYVSLFGVGGLRDLRVKTVQGLLQFEGKEKQQIKSIAAGVWSTAMKALKGFHEGFAALDDLAFLALPSLLKNRFIVLDDIERKHDGLAIDELLGFIDDCVRNYECRFLLILNEDKLTENAASALWQEFHEKVVDQEIRLETSAKEAFGVAQGANVRPWSPHLQQALEICDVTNIRVVRKTIRVVNSLLDEQGELPEYVMKRVVGPAALLSAIHFKALEDGPSAEFVITYEANKAFFGSPRGVDVGTQEDRDRVKWIGLMDRLHIHRVDAFEHAVCTYLKSGMLDPSFIRRKIEQFVAESAERSIQESVQQFTSDFTWDIHTSSKERIERAISFLPSAHLLTATEVTLLGNLVSTLEGGQQLESQLIDHWLEHFRTTHASLTARPQRLEKFLREDTHALIQEEVQTLMQSVRSQTTLYELFSKIQTRTSLRSWEQMYLMTLSTESVENALLSASPDELRLVVNVGVDCLANRSEGVFADAVSRLFLATCRSIVAHDTNPLLSRLIRATLQANAPDFDLEEAP